MHKYFWKSYSKYLRCFWLHIIGIFKGQNYFYLFNLYCLRPILSILGKLLLTYLIKQICAFGHSIILRYLPRCPHTQHSASGINMHHGKHRRVPIWPNTHTTMHQVYINPFAVTSSLKSMKFDTTCMLGNHCENWWMASVRMSPTPAGKHQEGNIGLVAPTEQLRGALS